MLSRLTTIAVTIFLAIFVQSSLQNDESGPPKVICMYSSSAKEAGNSFDLNNYNHSYCTHVVYGYVILQKTRIEVMHENDTVEISKLKSLKQRNPNVKVMVSLSGTSPEFYPVFESQATLEDFAKKAAGFLTKHGLDGLDISWDYPNPEDKTYFTRLMKALRNEFDNHKYILSAVGSPRPSKIKSIYEPEIVQKYLHFWNILTVSREVIKVNNVTTYSSPLFNYGKVWWSVDVSVKAWLNAGVPANKLVITIPFGGELFELRSQSCTNASCPASRISTDSDLPYYETCKIQDGNKVYDKVAKVPYLVKGNQWISYEDDVSIQYKLDYVLNNTLGGVLVSSLAADDHTGECEGGPYPLLKTISDIVNCDCDLPPSINSNVLNAIPPLISPPQSNVPSTTTTTKKTTPTTSSTIWYLPTTSPRTSPTTSTKSSSSTSKSSTTTTTSKDSTTTAKTTTTSKTSTITHSITPSTTRSRIIDPTIFTTSTTTPRTTTGSTSSTTTSTSKTSTITPKTTTTSTSTTTTHKTTTTSKDSTTTPKITTTSKDSTTTLKTTTTSTSTTTTPKTTTTSKTSTSTPKTTTTSKDSTTTPKSTTTSKDSTTTPKSTTTSKDSTTTPKSTTTSKDSTTTPKSTTTSKDSTTTPKSTTTSKDSTTTPKSTTPCKTSTTTRKTTTTSKRSTTTRKTTTTPKTSTTTRKTTTTSKSSTTTPKSSTSSSSSTTCSPTPSDDYHKQKESVPFVQIGLNIALNLPGLVSCLKHPNVQECASNVVYGNYQVTQDNRY